MAGPEARCSARPVAGVERQEDGVRPGFAAAQNLGGLDVPSSRRPLAYGLGPSGGGVPWELPEHTGSVTEEARVPEKPVSRL